MADEFPMKQRVLFAVMSAAVTVLVRVVVPVATEAAQGQVTIDAGNVGVMLDSSALSGGGDGFQIIPSATTFYLPVANWSLL